MIKKIIITANKKKPVLDLISSTDDIKLLHFTKSKFVDFLSILSI